MLRAFATIERRNLDALEVQVKLIRLGSLGLGGFMECQRMPG